MSSSLRRWAAAALELSPEATLEGQALSAEASFRSFYRVTVDADGASSYVLMSSPPDKENNESFCTLAGVFRDAGLPVPAIIARDDREGLYLLSDLGPRDLEAAYAEGAAGSAVARALETLVQLQTVVSPALQPYTVQRFRDELGIFSEWFLGALLDESPPASLASAFDTLVERTQSQPQCCVHRDYHCRNLLLDRAGNFGIVDFQDALVGPLAYDPASLLRDCYHEFSEGEVRAYSRDFLAAREAHTGVSYPEATFAVDLDFCAVQRQLKAIGIFARLKLRDGKSSHLRYVTPLLRRLRRLCAGYAPLAAIADYLATLEGREQTWQT